MQDYSFSFGSVYCGYLKKKGGGADGCLKYREGLILHQTNRIPLFVVPCVVHWYKQTCFQSQQSHFRLTSECNQCTALWSKREKKSTLCNIVLAKYLVFLTKNANFKGVTGFSLKLQASNKNWIVKKKSSDSQFPSILFSNHLGSSYPDVITLSIGICHQV